MTGNDRLVTFNMQEREGQFLCKTPCADVTVQVKDLRQKKF